MAKKRRKASPAQLAARKAFAAKYGGKKSKRKAAPSRAKRPSRRKRRAATSQGKHRLVVIRKHGKLYRPRRSSLPRRATFANPFLGGLAMIGNPRRKRRKSAKKSYRRSRGSRGLRLSNPFPAVLSAPREMATKGFAMEAVSVAAGFVLPNVIMGRLPASFRDSTVKAYASKVAVVAVLAGGTSLVSKRLSKAFLLGGGVSIALDLWTDFVAPAIGGAMGAAGVSTFYGDPGDPGTGTFYGDPGDPGVGSSLADAFGGGDGEAWG